MDKTGKVNEKDNIKTRVKEKRAIYQERFLKRKKQTKNTKKRERKSSSKTGEFTAAHFLYFSPAMYTKDHSRKPNRIIVATESFPAQSFEYWDGKYA